MEQFTADSKLVKKVIAWIISVKPWNKASIYGSGKAYQRIKKVFCVGMIRCKLLGLSKVADQAKESKEKRPVE